MVGTNTGFIAGDTGDLLARERLVREERLLHAAVGVVEDALGLPIGHEEEVEVPAGNGVSVSRGAALTTSSWKPLEGESGVFGACIQRATTYG
ncbi:hypothetical protein ABZP36_028485 [Zizania latifolia]